MGVAVIAVLMIVMTAIAMLVTMTRVMIRSHQGNIAHEVAVTLSRDGWREASANERGRLPILSDAGDVYLFPDVVAPT